jgi:adenylate cyclase
VPVQPVERKLAAIFAADIAGYSRLMAGDEAGTLAQLKASRAIIDERIASHRGRIFNTAIRTSIEPSTRWTRRTCDLTGGARPHIAGISSNNRPMPGSFSSTRMI